MSVLEFTRTTAIGARKFSDVFWRALLLIPPYSGVRFFYAFMPIVIVYLSVNNYNTGVAFIEREFGIPAVAIAAFFAVCGLFLSTPRKPLSMIAGVIPIGLYIIALIVGVASDGLPVTALTVIVYLIALVLTIIGLVRYAAEVENVKRRQETSEAKIVDLTRALAELTTKAENGEHGKRAEGAD